VNGSTWRPARALLAGLWAGGLWTIAAIVAPAAFALLARADAGRFVGRVFAQEAGVGLAIAMLLLLAERRAARLAGTPAMNTNLLLALGALFCTVAGYYALQPMMQAARVGQGALSFGALHAISTVFYGLKTLAVTALAFRLARGEPAGLRPSTS
jgi:Domain of unknown function (DUF4149)